MTGELLSLAAGAAVATGACWLLWRRGSSSTTPTVQSTLNADDPARLKAVLDAMSEGMALLDGDNRVLLCNPAFESMFRHGTGDVLAAGGDAAADRRGLLERVAEVRASGRAATGELALKTTPAREVEVTATPWSGGGPASSIIVVAYDVTKLRQAEQLRSAFVANVSHELRTPLAAIRGYVETCLDTMEAGDEPPWGRFIPIIQQHSLRLNALIEDLLMLSRIESAAFDVPLVPVQAGPLVESALATLRQQADDKQLALINATPPVLPDVLADAESTERVLLNLLENAVKYSEAGTEISVGARLQAGELVIFVKDQGVGISKEDQTRVFERFYRVDRARSRKAGGTGLGLSIVKHLVQRMKGTVWVDSEPGRGSTFFFTLPLAH